MKPMQPVRGTADLTRQKSQMNFVVEKAHYDSKQVWLPVNGNPNL